MLRLISTALVSLLLAACSGGDSVAGQYAVGGASFVLRANGTVEKLPSVDAKCQRDMAAIEACEDRQSWTRSGDKVTLKLGAIRDEMMCECDLDTVVATYRDGELRINGVAATRAR